MVFTLLFPFLAIILGLLDFPGGAKESFVESVLSYLPLSEYIEGVVIGINTARPGLSLLEYGIQVLQIVTDNIEAFMYVGMWLYMFRVIFSEILITTTKVGKVVPIFSGVPIFQVTLGLFFAAFTYGLFGTGKGLLVVTSVLIVVNFVLTAVFVKKPLWKKILDLFLNLGLQSYLAALSAGYVIVLLYGFRGYYESVVQGIIAIVIVVLLWIIYLVTQYLVSDK